MYTASNLEYIKHYIPVTDATVWVALSVNKTGCFDWYVRGTIDRTLATCAGTIDALQALEIARGILLTDCL